MADAIRYARRAKGAYLRVVYRPVPPPREERRIGAEDDPLGAGDLERLHEDTGERQAVVVRHPTVGARRVEVHVRAEVGDEQRLPKESCPEVRNDERYVGVVGGQCVKIE